MTEVVSTIPCIACAFDGLGRVIQATNSTTGQAVLYAYDAAGNITSQQVVPLGTLALAGFSTNSAGAGTQLTIDGTGFSTTASSNTVTINGVAATVVSATATQLVVVIPSGAGSGPITVTTGGTSVTSAGAFTVTAGVNTPAVTGFSPASGTVGAVITISGTNFTSSAALEKVLINATEATIVSTTPTTLTVQVPPNTGSGRITVVTQYGTSTSSGYLLIPPSGYTAGTISATVAVTKNGAMATVPLTSPNEVVLGFFEASQGDQFVRALGQAPNTSSVQVIDPSGKAIGSFSTGTFLDLPTLPRNGTYTMILTAGVATGSAGLAISQGSVKALDTTWRATANFPSTAGVVGQTHRYAVVGIAGEALAIAFNTPLNPGGQLELVNSSGSILWQSSITGNTTPTVFIPGLPSAGTYSLVLDPGMGGFNSYSFSSGIGVTVVADAAASLLGIASNTALGGNVLSAGRVYFQGTAGQTLTFHTTHDSSWPGQLPNVNLSLYQGASTTPISVFSPFFYAPDYSLQIRSLPATDTYHFELTPTSPNTNAFDVRLLSSPGVSAPLGGSTSLVLNNVGQLGKFTFNGSAGAYMGIELSTPVSTPLTNVTYTILAPDGSSVTNWVSASLVGGGPVTIPLQTLQSGQYTMWILPTTGTFNVSLVGAGQIYTTYSQDSLSIAPGGAATLTASSPVTGTISIAGATVPITTTLLGQSARFTFSALINQSPTFTASNVTFSSTAFSPSQCRAALALYPPGQGGTRTYQSIAQGGSFLNGFPVIYPASNGNTAIRFASFNFTGTYTIEIEVMDGCTVSMNATLN